MINAFQIESLNVLGLSDSKAIIITCYYGEAASEDKRMLSGARGRTPFCGLVLFALCERGSLVCTIVLAVHLYIEKYAQRD